MSKHIVVMIQHGYDRRTHTHTPAATCLLSLIMKQCCDQVLGCDIEDKGGGFGWAHCSNLG